MEKYSQFGLAFKKSYLITKGATPVFYVSKKSLIEDFSKLPSNAYSTPQRNTLEQVFEDFNREFQELLLRVDKIGHVGNLGMEIRSRQDMLIWAQLKFFDAMKEEHEEENFYMEREWRVMNDVEFALDDVCRIILPEPFAKRFRTDVPDYCGQITFAG